MYEIRVVKNRIRTQYLDKRKALPAALRAERDAKICERLVLLATYRYADTILMYAPKGDEIDVSPIALDALASGKTVAFPRCRPESRTMNYHIVTSLSELKPESYGILEPPESLPILEKGGGKSAICLVPALCYDRRGYRLGYGKGYYDRYLADFEGLKAGVVYGDFIAPQLPRGRYDLAVDVIVTEKGVIALRHAN